jgi:scyllo-inositol 2-dehydrogenase (NADP+)
VQKLGNGNTYDLGSHLLDQVVHLWGVPQRIFADIRDERGASADKTVKFLENEGFIDDSFDLLLYYDRVKDSTKIPKQGLRVKLSSTTSSLVPKQLRYVVRGTLAGYIKHGIDPQEPQTKAGIAMSDPKFGVEEEDMWGVLTWANGVSEPVKTKRGVYTKFFEYLANGQAPVDPEEVLGVIRVIEAAGVSVREGRVVDL